MLGLIRKIVIQCVKFRSDVFCELFEFRLCSDALMWQLLKPLLEEFSVVFCSAGLHDNHLLLFIKYHMFVCGDM